jgi:hypothetical protein
MLSRETGHNRVPAPPHMITGTIRVFISKSLATIGTFLNSDAQVLTRYVAS